MPPSTAAQIRASIRAWLPDDDESERADNIFVGVTRVACGLAHFVNPNPGIQVREPTKSEWSAGLEANQSFFPSNQLPF
jgi:hypothetical protein